MFYAHFVLSKKGPLAKVWLAAHWERKLTKAHVFETNIEETVEDILNPKVKLALRTSGHLLLGVVRIYSRKAKYLLQDCNDALGRIKLAFRPVSIDLPVESRVATKTAVTLTVPTKEMVPREYNMTEIDFDMDIEEFSPNELSIRFRANQAVEEAITLKETVVGENQRKKDNALVVDFNDLDMILDFDIEEDGNSPFGFGKHDIFGNRLEDPDHELPTNLFEDPDDAIIDEPATADGLKNGVGSELAKDGGLVPPEETGNAAPADLTEDILTNGDLALNNVDELRDNVDLNASARTSVDPQPLAAKPAANERMRVKRKRKLLIDEQKTISSDQMRLQLQDTSDIVRVLEMAPSTLQLMYIREFSTVEKMWNMPGYMGDDWEVPGCSKILMDMFLERNLIPIAEDLDDTDDFFPATSSIPTLRSMRDFDVDEDLAVVPDISDVDPGRRAAADKAKQPRDCSPVNDVPDEENEPFELDPAQNNNSNKRAKITNGESDDESGDEDAHPEDHDRMSRRTKVVFDEFASLLNRRHTPRNSTSNADSVTFKELVRGHQSRKEVAQRFYSTLVLKKLQAVHVVQDVAYGEITITKGGRFEQFSV